MYRDEPSTATPTGIPAVDDDIDEETVLDFTDSILLSPTGIPAVDDDIDEETVFDLADPILLSPIEDSSPSVSMS